MPAVRIHYGYDGSDGYTSGSLYVASPSKAALQSLLGELKKAIPPGLDGDVFRQRAYEFLAAQGFPRRTAGPDHELEDVSVRYPIS